MLPTRYRLRRPAELRSTMRRGRRAGGATLVVCLRIAPADASPAAVSSRAAPRAGFVVGRAVGPAVVRNRVRRRLRHLLAARLGELPAGSQVVVRALPPAASAGSAELAADLDRALRRLGARLDSVGAGC